MAWSVSTMFPSLRSMPETGLRATARFRVANVSIFIGTISGIVVLIGLLLVFDLFLAHIDERESAARADTEYQNGLAALRAGHPSDAVDHFGAAVGIERSNVNYALALGEAMLQAGRTAEAEETLRTLLERAENDGAVNLTMAHVMVREARTEDAKAYLHRAIFGRWGADSIDRRNQARFELIDLLAKRGTPRELLAELLPFEEVSPDSVALRLQLGKLFILAGSPVRAATMFREVLRRDSTDGDAYAGLGETAIAAGNLRTARADLAEAVRLRPDDAETLRRLGLVDTVLALDPTARGIGASERLSRSRGLLARAVAVVSSCGGPAAAALDSARALLSRPPTRRSSQPRENSEADADRLMQAVTDVWATRTPACDAATHDDVVRLLVARINQ
jgi:Flp pilus assembly protein TadD